MWSTNNQEYTFSRSQKSDLHAYITTLVKSLNGIVFATGGGADHVHLLIYLPPNLSLSHLTGQIKAYSSKWLKSHEKISSNFSWQQGYLAFSTQKDRVGKVCDYISSDESRHLSKSYPEELMTILNQQGISFNEKYYLQSSHSKIYAHAIWSTQNRMPFLDKDICPELYAIMSNAVASHGGVIHEIGGISDHVHLLLEIPKNRALSDLIREIKTSATHWLKMIDRSRFRDFEWQTGYGAYTTSLTTVDIVKGYIQQQEEHHRVKTFQEEWNEFVSKN
jgi:REP element-mobilizing transposase RayT